MRRTEAAPCGNQAVSAGPPAAPDAARAMPVCPRRQPARPQSARSREPMQRAPMLERQGGAVVAQQLGIQRFEHGERRHARRVAARPRGVRRACRVGRSHRVACMSRRSSSSAAHTLNRRRARGRSGIPAENLAIFNRPPGERENECPMTDQEGRRAILARGHPGAERISRARSSTRPIRCPFATIAAANARNRDAEIAPPANRADCRCRRRRPHAHEPRA